MLSLSSCRFRPSVDSWEPWTRARDPEVVLSERIQVTGPVGGPFAAAPGVVELSNSGGSSFLYVVEGDQLWLGLDDDSSRGSVRPGTKRGVPITIDTARVPEAPGRYSGRITVRNGVTHVVEGTVPVDLVVVGKEGS